MTTFKVGDKIRCRDSKNANLSTYGEYVVTFVACTSWIEVQKTGRIDKIGLFHPNRFDLVEEAAPPIIKPKAEPMKFEVGKKYQHSQCDENRNTATCLAISSRDMAILEFDHDGTIHTGPINKYWSEYSGGNLWINTYRYESGAIQHSVHDTHEKAKAHAVGPYYIATTKAEWKEGNKL